jgi:hypothetical protein
VPTPRQPFPISPDDLRATPSIADDEEGEAPDMSAPEDASVEEQEDGSAIVKLPEDEKKAPDEFDGNIAETVDASELAGIVDRLLLDFDRDREARKGRDAQYAEGIKRTGIGQDAPGGAEFDGASRATHPMLVEGCIDFASRAIKELFPAKGPCRTQIIGEATRGALEKAERKKTYMNWQLTKQIAEYRSQLEACLTQVPLGGSQYLKVYPDAQLKRPRVEVVYIDDVLLPFAATDFYSAQRITHVQHLTSYEFDARVASGTYRSIADLGASSDPGEKSEAAKASEKAEGKEDMAYNEDGLRTVYETNVLLCVDSDPQARESDEGVTLPSPYIMTIDEVTRQCVALRRNWEEEDEKRERLHWLVEFGLIPWRGAYKIGLAHLIGSLQGAATGSLRALLDSAHIANFPGGLLMQGEAGAVAGQTTMSSPGELTQIKAPIGVTDIRALAMPFPFAGPSTVLFQLLEWLTQHGSEVIGTAEEKLGDNPQNAPVGTTLAMIEQGSITYSAVHGRLHESQKRVMEIIHRLNADLVEDEETIEELGSLVVYRADFQGPMDVIPVSDPNIFSDAQRYAQLQAVMAMAQQYPQFYKADVLNRRALMLLNYPAYDEILATPGDPKRRNAVDENVAARLPETCLKAYDDQDHLLHLQMHLQFATSPIFAASQLMANPTIGVLLAHCAEHLIEYYKKHAEAAQQAVHEVMTRQPGHTMDDAAKEAAMHEAMVNADQVMAQELAQILPLIDQAQQAAQKFAPQPPADPQAASKQAEIQAKSQADAAKLQAQQQSDAAKAQATAQAAQAQAAADIQAAQLKEQGANARHSEEMAIAARNADIAATAEHAKQAGDNYATHVAESGATQRTAMANETAILIAQMKADQAHYAQQIDTMSAMLHKFIDAQQPAEPLDAAPADPGAAP